MNAADITADLIETRRPNHMLPAHFYLSSEIFAQDLDIFFGRHWIFVGVEADVPASGDYIAIDVGPQSIIIARGRDGDVKAFANICRHRGARLCNSGRGHAPRLVCPYHQWTYDLAGKLLFARHMGKDFETDGLNLIPVNLRRLAGLLFICLSQEGPDDFDLLAEEMEPRLAPFDLSNAKIAHEEDLIEEGNWKLTIENNRECYHCDGSHPELGRSFVVGDFFSYAAEESPFEPPVGRDALYRKWESLGLVNAATERQQNCETPFRAERLVIAGEGESQTLDTKVACRKLLGAIDDPKLGDVHFWTFNSWHHFMSDHAVCIYIVPLAPDRTLVRTKWLVASDAVEGRDYDIDNLTRVWRATNRQDGELVARTHAGVADPGFLPGPYSPVGEVYVNNFATWYLERLRAHVG